MRKLLFGIGLIPVLTLQAQNPEKKAVSFSSYIDTYYLYDFGEPQQDTRPSFIYSYNRHHQYSLNLGMLKASLQQQRVRANLAIAAGTYMDANYQSEPGILKHLFEANAGVKLLKKNELWLDAGIFPSHIGFESAIGKDCWNLTRSMLAENSPYYEAGLKLSYTTVNGKWFFSALLLNGWQRIKRKPGVSIPSFGHQITYKPSEKFTLNSSSFFGTEWPDLHRQWRYFHNLYAQLQLHKKWGLIVGFDIGMEQWGRGSSMHRYWLSPVLIAQYKPSSKLALSGRVEYFHDPREVLITTSPEKGFFTWGYSLNIDYQILENLLWRTELRSLISRHPVFLNKERPANSNQIAVTSIALSF